MQPDWLTWAQNLQALAQSGIAFSKDPFDKERYEAIRTIAAEMIASHSDMETETIQNLFEQQEGYATPKVGVRGAVFQNDKILLVKEKLDHGRWTIPGGFIDINESPSEAVVREIQEESGYETRAVKLLDMYDPQKHNHPPKLFHIYHIYFLCEITGGAPTHSIETDGVHFFGEDEIPDLSAHRVTAEQISKLFAHHRNPNLPTEFD